LHGRVIQGKLKGASGPSAFCDKFRDHEDGQVKETEGPLGFWLALHFHFHLRLKLDSQFSVNNNNNSSKNARCKVAR
jgi:hypothetical protein